MRLLIIILFLAGSAAFASEYPGRIEQVNGTPTLHINGKPVYASALRWGLGWGSSDKLFFAKDFGPARQFGEAGTPVVLLAMDSGWKGPGLYDYQAIDRAIDKVFSDSPDTWLIPSIHLEYARWYSSRHPDEAFTVKEKNELTKLGGSIIASFNSKRFENDAREALTRFVAHMAERGYSSRIIGYQINYGATAEWRYWDQGKNRPDWNPEAVAAWREYARDKYRTIDRLNTSWKTSYPDFAAIEPPEGTFRGVYRAGYLRDPAQDCQVADYADFVMASICHLMQSFSAHIKQLTNGKALVGMYNFNQHPSLGKAGTVDFTVSSTFYPDRAANGTALSQTLGLEYLRRTGVLYWHDADMRTYLWPDERWGVARNVYESAMTMRREFLSMLINGAGNAWLNLHYHRNVYDNPNLMNTAMELEAVASTAVSAMQYDLSSSAEIAVVYDRTRFPAFWGNSAMYNNFTRIGAAVDFFPADRLELIDPQQYKLIILVSCPLISDAGLKHLELLKGGNRTILFLYANGMETDQGLRMEAVENLNGFKHKQLPDFDRSVQITGDWQKDFGTDIPALGKMTGPANAFRLTVAPREGDEVIGISPADREVLFARHRYPEWTSYYFHNYQMHARIMRQIARQAGVTVNFPYDDAYFQRNKYFWLVNSAAGERELTVGNHRSVYDVFNDSELPVANGKVTLSMSADETKLLLTDTPERIQEFRRHYQNYAANHKIAVRPERFEMDIMPNDRIFYLMSGEPRQINIRLRADRPFSGGTLSLELPDGWASPPVTVEAMQQYEVKNYQLAVTPSANGMEAESVFRLTEAGKNICEVPAKLVARDYTWLSDLPYRGATTGWGVVGRDVSCMNQPLWILQKTYPKGMGVHAPSELVYNLDAKWSKMNGLVGVDRAAGKGGMGVASCEFKIIGDGRELFASGKRLGGDPPVAFEVDLSGVKELRLVVGNAGDGQKSDHGDWCEVKLYPASSAL